MSMYPRIILQKNKCATSVWMKVKFLKANEQISKFVCVAFSSFVSVMWRGRWQIQMVNSIWAITSVCRLGNSLGSGRRAEVNSGKRTINYCWRSRRGLTGGGETWWCRWRWQGRWGAMEVGVTWVLSRAVEGGGGAAVKDVMTPLSCGRMRRPDEGDALAREWWDNNLCRKGDVEYVRYWWGEGGGHVKSQVSAHNCQYLPSTASNHHSSAHELSTPSLFSTSTLLPSASTPQLCGWNMVSSSWCLNRLRSLSWTPNPRKHLPHNHHHVLHSSPQSEFRDPLKKTEHERTLFSKNLFKIIIMFKF